LNALFVGLSASQKLRSGQKKIHSKQGTNATQGAEKNMDIIPSLPQL